MSLLRRLLGRRDPADVVYTGRVGFDGRPLRPQTGGLTGLESGGSPYVPDHYKN